MILADKIIELRKKFGYTQEDLAEKLDVSRQSISKWEGALSTPDLNKIIALSKVFGVSTDYLLNDEIEHIEGSPVPEEETFKSVSLETANAYISENSVHAKKIALGVFLCIISPVPVVFFSGLAENTTIPIKAEIILALSVAFLIICVAFAVGMFIKSSLYMEKYEYIEKEYTLLDYGVEGVVKKERENYRQNYNNGLVTGIVLCILSVVPVIISSFLEEHNPIYTFISVSFLLFIVAMGVYLIISRAIKWDTFKQLLNEEEYSLKGLEDSKIVGNIAKIYWPIVVAIYLAWSFTTHNWDITWIVWPVAGVLFGGIAGIVSIVGSKKKN
ncbi:MAG: helix-turn-helix domain-containing protein [Christensenellaceae bacterium]|nr:helix-turn-helix domain-containing protein [Christensenellaceae bacterium]